MPRKYLTTAQAEEQYGIPKRTLEKLRVTGGGPRFHRPGGVRTIYYAVADLDEWMGAALSSTSEGAG